MKRGFMKIVGCSHRNLFFILPCFSHAELRCDDPNCNAPHGWVIELGWLWFSLCLENTPGGPALEER